MTTLESARRLWSQRRLWRQSHPAEDVPRYLRRDWSVYSFEYGRVATAIGFVEACELAAWLSVERGSLITNGDKRAAFVSGKAVGLTDSADELQSWSTE
ncbi:hypothetical protein LCGC14_2377840 [marine sediment metagenome]|uniref:Uncharacterized protein n=1 Tax=marine sediment metagenome TaxID=412755 RepID=A0A0F9CP21_9ZZZZ